MNRIVRIFKIFSFSTVIFLTLSCVDNNNQNTNIQNSQAPHDEKAELILQDLTNKSVKLSDFKGKVVLVNFWATWCAPCVQEMPSFERLYQQYKNRGLEIVAVSSDANFETLNTFVKSNAFSFTVLHDPGLKLANQFGVTGFPETFVLNRQGELIEVLDPSANTKVEKFVSTRPWDAPSFKRVIESLL